jgi:hypothetical protein
MEEILMKKKTKRKLVAVLCVAVLSVPAIAVEVIPNGESMVKEVANAISEGREANFDSIYLDEVETTIAATVEVSSTLAAETTATTATATTTAATTTTTTETTATTKATTTTTATSTTKATTTTTVAKAAKTTAVTTKRATTQTTTKKTTPKKEEAPTQQIEVAEDHGGQVADADAHEPIIAGAGAPQDMGGVVPQNDWNEPAENSWSDDDVVIADEPANDWSGPVLNPHDGIVLASQTPSGYKETYYNLRMDGCLRLMGLDQSLASVREDGVKTYDGYVMVASPNLSAYPKGSYVETTLGTGIVVDYCPSGNLDIATTW